MTDCESFPPYREVHAGPVMVCGNGWPLHEDLARARGIYPAAPVIAVNDAAHFVPADFLFSKHREKLAGWAAAQRQAFQTTFTVHSGVPWPHRKREDFPAVQYWWPGANNGGSSGWCAARLAWMMGFRRIVLCGVPIAPGPYSDGSEGKDWHSGNVDQFAALRRFITNEKWLHPFVSSMSGWTLELLGPP